MVIEGVLAAVLERLGLAGVSTVVLVALASVVIWSSRVRHASYVASRTVSTGKWVALSLLALTVAGVVAWRPGRAAALWAAFWDRWPTLLRLLGVGG